MNDWVSLQVRCWKHVFDAMLQPRLIQQRLLSLWQRWAAGNAVAMSQPTMRLGPSPATMLSDASGIESTLRRTRSSTSLSRLQLHFHSLQFIFTAFQHHTFAPSITPYYLPLAVPRRSLSSRRRSATMTAFPAAGKANRVHSSERDAAESHCILMRIKTLFCCSR